MKLQDKQNLQNLRKLNTSLKQIEHQIVQIDEKNVSQNNQSQIKDKNGHQHNSDEEQQCQNHGHNHSGHKHGNKDRRKPGQKNYTILVYTVFTCLSCLYLETQCLNPFIGDSKSKFMSYFTYFTVIMALWSYYQTIVTDPGVKKLKQKEVKPYNFDYQKRCQKCDYWKGPRISHCSTCGKCIYKLDHHCMWTQTCIGYTNQKSFYLFCVYMTIGLVQFWYSTIRSFSILFNTCHFFGQFEFSIYILWGITCLSAGIVGIMIVGLTIGHFFYITTNFTTLQSMKTKRVCSFPFIQFRKSYFDPKYINIYDRGELQNLKILFGSSLLKCWMPTSRQIQNQFMFEPINPLVEQITQKNRIDDNLDEIKSKLTGKRIGINNKIIQY